MAAHDAVPPRNPSEASNRSMEPPLPSAAGLPCRTAPPRGARHGSATAHQRPDDRDARPAPDVQVAQVQGRSRPRRRPHRRGGRDLRLPRPERRRQDHDAADARDAPHADRRARRPSPAPTCAASRRQVRAGSATCPRAARPIRPRPAAASSSSRAGCTAWTSRRPRRRAAEVLAALDLEAAADRPTEHLLGRHEAAGSTSGSASSTSRPSCSSTSRRPASTRRRARGCGTRSAQLREPGHDRLPDDALPRGGRRARRPAGDHRPRQDRRRGHRRRAQARGRRRRRDDRRQTGRPSASSKPSGDSRSSARRPARTASSGSTSTAARRRSRCSSASSTASGLEASSITLHRPSLDDVFLRQTGRSLRDEAAPDRPDDHHERTPT